MSIYSTLFCIQGSVYNVYILYNVCIQGSVYNVYILYNVCIQGSVYSRFPKFHRAFLGRDSGTLKSDIVSKKHPRLNCSDSRLSY